ncbi:PH domain-containing protein [Turicimonas muris]|uniref:PH domain-containing protein n=1 Tax=Turicimonas muris TaxID=1796652 RepID=UPI00272D1704|nr:PH domain-containing protein [Turicimonas muris]
MSTMAFDGQREGEQVELIFRRHMSTIWRGVVWLIVWSVLGVVPMLLWRDDQRMFFVWLGALMIGLLGLLYTYMLWHFSYYLVTNQRIRQVRQKGLFRKTVVDLGLDKIQSISYEVPGIKGGMMGYGTLLIQTQVGDMTISMVRKPEKIYNILQDLANKAIR